MFSRLHTQGLLWLTYRLEARIMMESQAREKWAVPTQAAKVDWQGASVFGLHCDTHRWVPRMIFSSLPEGQEKQLWGSIR